MTSEREWGCYQTLPGIAIYQLSTRPDIDAIGLTRWVWNGRERGLLHNTEATEAQTVPHERTDETELVTAESPDKTLSANTGQ
jgi:hypothetical protein